MITKHIVAEKLYSYLNHEITLPQLVDWSENVVNEEDIAEEDTDAVMSVATRIGVADVENFGLLWKDCDDMLHQLGYELNFDLKKVA